MGRHKTVGIKTMTRKEYNAYYRRINFNKRRRDRESDGKTKAAPTHKICTACKDKFPLTNEFFYKTGSGPLGKKYFLARCKTCTNKYNIARKFGISEEHYDRIRGQHCDICWVKGRMYVDHCHLTKRIRGVLCLNCNTALGKMKDRPDLLRRAAEYLEDRA